MNNEILRKLSYGMYIIGVENDGKKSGFIANTVMQITSEKPTIAISVNRNNYTCEGIENRGMFSISVLHEATDPNVISLFGFSSSKDNDKWSNVEYIDVEGMPIYKESCGYLVCKVINKMETQTHTVFLGEIINADVLQDKHQMTYEYYHKVIKGKSPKNAPTYIEEKIEESKYVCDICGYVYDGEIPFEQLPEDYRCPVCGADKSHFKLR